MAVIIPGKIYQAQEDFGSVETTLVSAESGFRNAASVFVIIGWWSFEFVATILFFDPSGSIIKYPFQQVNAFFP